MTGPFVVKELKCQGYGHPRRCCGIHALDGEPCVDYVRVVSVKAFETRHGEQGWWEYVCGLVNALGKVECLSLTQRTAFATAYDYARLQLGAEGGKVELPDGREIVVEARRRSELVEELKKLDWHRFNDYMSTHLRSAHNDPTRCRQVLCHLLNEAWAERYGTEGRA